MAIYHLSVKIIGRSSGKSAIASAAYRSGEKLHDNTNNKTYNYMKKSDIDFCEILLPENAPQEFSDRETLWNNVELSEKNSNAQLAREIEFSLPTELNFEEQKKLAHNFALSFVKEGMCVDLAFHNKKGNPHCHMMLTMKSLDSQGKWQSKNKVSYELDKNGNKIPVLDKFGQQKIGERGRKLWKRIKVSTNDWDNRGKVEEWRSRWSDMANKALEREGKTQRIDHRSFARQGIDLIPTIHLGQAAHALEKQGIRTVKGNLNRFIAEKNAELTQIYNKIGQLSKAKSTSVESSQFAQNKVLGSAIFNTGEPSCGGLQGFLRTDISELIKELVKNGKSEQEIEEILEEVEAGNYVAASGAFFAMQEVIRQHEEKEREEDERREQKRKQQNIDELSEQERQNIITGIARSKRDIERFKRAINSATSSPSKEADGIREPQSICETVACHDSRPAERNYVAELLAFRNEEAKRELARISKEREETERRERELANKPKSTESGTGTIERATPADESIHSSPSGTKTASITTEEPVHIRPRGITRTTEQTTAKNQRGFSR